MCSMVAYNAWPADTRRKDGDDEGTIKINDSKWRGLRW